MSLPLSLLLFGCGFIAGPFLFLGNSFSPTAERFGVSAQIGSGVVRGGPEVRFHEGSTRVSPGFHEVLRGSARAAGWCEH